MNKNLEKYEKKFNKLIKTFEIIGISILLLGILISIIYYAMNKSKSLEENQKGNIDNANYTVSLEDKTVIYQNSMDINISIKNFEEQKKYKIIIEINENIVIEQENINSENDFTIDLVDEGSKNINIMIYENDQENYNKSFVVYYIQPYEKQFLDELSNKSIQTHYIDGTWEAYENSLKMINYMRI